MARYYDDMEDDNPINEDFQEQTSSYCKVCGEPLYLTSQEYCSEECELLDLQKQEE